MSSQKDKKATYTYNEAMESSLNYFNGDELAANVFLGKYALKDKQDNLVESNPEDMHWRIANEFARVEKNKFKNPMSAKQIFSYLDKFKYIVPQGSPMFGIGNNYQIVSISNCYVTTSPFDSYVSIISTDNEMAQISKRRGGVGADLDNIRPLNSPVSNAARSSTGVTPFMKRYSNTIREVGQSGRRGALMLTISVHHPESVILLDSEEEAKPIIIPGNKESNTRDIHTTTEFYNPNVTDFCTIKFDRTQVTGANISIKLTDEFMEAVKNGTTYEQRWPVDAREKGEEPKFSKQVDARRVWRKIIHAAWQVAEPGLLMWDHVRTWNAIDCYEKYGFKTTCTNPCSELPLCEHDSCRLLVQNLYSYVVNPFTKDSYFDFDLFKEHARIAQRLMDDMIDLELEKIDQIISKIDSDPEPDKIKKFERDLWVSIREKCFNGRRTGTGVTATADTLAALNIQYGSDKSIKILDEIHRIQKLECFRSSVEMSKEIGSFPVWNWDIEKDSLFLKQIEKEDKDLYNSIKVHGRRNIGLLTVAPTGSVSILTQTTSGVEPLFKLDPYIRNKKINPNDKNARIDFTDQNGDSWQRFPVYHPKVNDWMKITGEKDISKSPWFGSTANDLDWTQRVKVQSAIQTHIDHAISSTINLPENVSESNVAKIYETAWEFRCKGMTVYRDGCRSGVLVSKTEANKDKNPKIHKTTAPKRTKEVECDIHHTKSRGEDFFVIVGMLDSQPYEVFAGKNKDVTHSKKGVLTKNKRGHYELKAEDGSVIENVCDLLTDEQAVITRMISLSLRHGSDVAFIVDQLEKSPGDMTNFGKAMARVLKKYINDGEKVSGAECPECNNSQVVRESGCKTCKNCGWSACG